MNPLYSLCKLSKLENFFSLALVGVAILNQRHQYSGTHIHGYMCVSNIRV